VENEIDTSTRSRSASSRSTAAALRQRRRASLEYAASLIPIIAEIRQDIKWDQANDSFQKLADGLNARGIDTPADHHRNSREGATPPAEKLQWYKETVTRLLYLEPEHIEQADQVFADNIEFVESALQPFDQSEFPHRGLALWIQRMNRDRLERIEYINDIGRQLRG
jgi:hypothetical protein